MLFNFEDKGLRPRSKEVSSRDHFTTACRALHVPTCPWKHLPCQHAVPATPMSLADQQAARTHLQVVAPAKSHEHGDWADSAVAGQRARCRLCPRPCCLCRVSPSHAQAQWLGSRAEPRMRASWLRDRAHPGPPAPLVLGRALWRFGADAKACCSFRDEIRHAIAHSVCERCNV